MFLSAAFSFSPQIRKKKKNKKENTKYRYGQNLPEFAKHVSLYKTHAIIFSIYFITCLCTEIQSIISGPYRFHSYDITR